MIEIEVFPSGDLAEAETPEAAILAARTMVADDLEANPIRGRMDVISVVFRHDGNAWSLSYRALMDRA